MKPIEPGCLAIVVRIGRQDNRAFLGKTVNVIDRITNMGDHWRHAVKKFKKARDDLHNVWAVTLDGREFGIMEESLMRIDDDQEEISKEESEELCRS